MIDNAQINWKASNVERWQTIADGAMLWTSHPVFGAGLGAYVQERLADGLSFQVIHSVPVWLLAETGIAGFVLAVAVGLWVTISLWRRSDSEDDGLYARAALVALFIFAMFGVVHDMFVQRSFWFLFGLLAALTPVMTTPKPEGARTDVLRSPAPAA